MSKYHLKTAKLLYKTAKEMGLKPEWLTDHGLFSIEVGEKIIYIFNSFSVFNTQLSSQLSRNKHNARVLIEKNNLPNIPFALAKTKDEVIKFLGKHNLIIAKPILGSDAQDVHLIRSIDDVDELVWENYILEKYIRGRELRYLILNNEVIGVHEQQYEGDIYDSSTIQRISYPKNMWREELIKISLAITEIMGLKFAAVDFILDESEKAYILEINSAPGLYRFQDPSSGPAIDLARIFLEATIKKYV